MLSSDPLLMPELGKRIPQLSSRLQEAHDPDDLDGYHAKLVARHKQAQKAQEPMDSSGSSIALSKNIPLARDHPSPSTAQPIDTEDDDEASESIKAYKGKRRATFIELADDDETATTDIEIINDEPGSSAEGSKTQEKKNKKKAKKKRKAEGSSAATQDEHDEQGFLKDIDVQEIKPVPTAQAGAEENRRDINAFFSAPEKRQGKTGIKDHSRCLKCRSETWIVTQPTTMRRHIEATHLPLFRKWASDNNFESKLPKDVKVRKEALETIKQQQQVLDGHLQDMSKKERVIAYSELAFKRAAVEWLIATDQPIWAFEHSTFREMIQLAARATGSVKIPDRKAARKQIMDMWHERMGGLKAHFETDAVTGEISLTCDAWQASNTDGYFVVTGHFIEGNKDGTWKLRNVILGFTRLNNSHNGERLGQALFKIVDRLGIARRVGHVTCDNASNNGTMLKEFARLIKEKLGMDFDYIERRINCLAHVINLATQEFISTYSKAPHYDPKDPDKLDDSVKQDRDEIGLIRAITVKERSSANRKEIFRKIQRDAGVQRPLQLLLDMKVRWSSTYVMVHRAEANKLHVNDFVHEIGRLEPNYEQRKKLYDLQLSEAEWQNAETFLSLLADADNAQHAFSPQNVSTLHLALPALEALHKAWLSCSERDKYARFHLALNAGLGKVAQYYDKTDTSDAYVVVMYLGPDSKGAHFKKNWSVDLAGEAEESMKRIFEVRWYALHESSTSVTRTEHKKKPTKIGALLRELSSDDESDDAPLLSSDAGALMDDPDKPWMPEYLRYTRSVEHVPESMSTIEWWGCNGHRYGSTWQSLARGYLAIMASSVSSERAFSQAGITISDRRSRLKADVVEALQFMKCDLRNDLLFKAPAPSSAVENTISTEELGEDAEKPTQSSPWDLVILDDDDTELFE